MPNLDETHKRILEKKRKLGDIDHLSMSIFDKKIHREETENEFQKINKYSEGRCYGCATNDYVAAMTLDICYICIGKRGDFYDSSLLTFIMDKAELFCSLCGQWRFGGAHLNARLCRKCGFRVGENLKKYANEGGAMSNPFYQYLRRKQGNDWRWLEANHRHPYRK